MHKVHIEWQNISQILANIHSIRIQQKNLRCLNLCIKTTKIPQYHSATTQTRQKAAKVIELKYKQNQLGSNNETFKKTKLY